MQLSVAFAPARACTDHFEGAALAPGRAAKGQNCDTRSARTSVVAEAGPAAARLPRWLFATPEVCKAPEERGVHYAIRIPAHDSLERDIAELLPRPLEEPEALDRVQGVPQAASSKTARRVVAKVDVTALRRSGKPPERFAQQGPRQKATWGSFHRRAYPRYTPPVTGRPAPSSR